MINPVKLSRELNNAGIENSGCNSNGTVWAVDGITEIQNREDVKKIISAHDPTEAKVIDEVAELRAQITALTDKLASKKVITDAEAADITGN